MATKEEHAAELALQKKMATKALADSKRHDDEMGDGKKAAPKTPGS